MKYLIIAIILFTTQQNFGQSINIDRKIGDKNFQHIKNTNGLYADSSMTAYINKVGERLVSQLDSALFDYHFYIVKDEVPNAFATPGGRIFITTGLIPILNSEDELAGIIGHEIIHSNNRHSIRQIRKSILPSLIILPITIADAIVPVLSTFTMPITTSEDLLFAGYSRKSETEADEQGVILAAKAGYNPLALISALNRLMKTFEFMTGEKEKQSYFADHPYTPDRDKDIKSIADTININELENISNNFISEFDGIIYGHSPDKGVLKNNTLYQINKNLYIKYPEYWRVINNDTVVMGYSPHKDATYILKFIENNLSTKELADKFIENFPKKHKDMIVSSGYTKVNNINCYQVNLEEYLSNDTLFVKKIWMPLDNYILGISIMSDINNNTTMLDITESIRSLNDDEKKSIKVKLVKIVKAKEGETIKNLCERVGNVISYHMIATINGISINEKLKENQQIKIVIEEPYLDNL